MTFTILSHAATLTLGLWLGINMSGISGAGSITAALNPSPQKCREVFYSIYVIIFCPAREGVFWYRIQYTRLPISIGLAELIQGDEFTYLLSVEC